MAKDSICEPGIRPSVDNRPAGSMILIFPASRTLRNKHLLLEPPSLWYSVLET
jgi:hypothetical protein